MSKQPISITHLGGEKCVTIFSGDLGCKNTPMLPDPDTPDSCDLLVMESTYGNRNHEGRKERLQTLGQKLVKALADKCCIIP